MRKDQEIKGWKILFILLVVWTIRESESPWWVKKQQYKPY